MDDDACGDHWGTIECCLFSEHVIVLVVIFLKRKQYSQFQKMNFRFGYDDMTEKSGLWWYSIAAHATVKELQKLRVGIEQTDHIL